MSERFPGDMSSIVRQMLAAVEANDVDKTVSFFSEDAFYKVGNADPVFGPQGIREFATPVMQMFKSVSHDIKAMWEVGEDTVVCEMQVTYVRNDSKLFKLPCCDIIRLDGKLIQELQAYLDISPLFAQSDEKDGVLSEQENLQIVKDLYAAFHRGDGQAWLNALADDVTWQVYGPAEIPLSGLRKGPKQVAAFFQTLFSTVGVEVSEQKDFIAQGDKVIVLGHVKSKVNGHDFASEYVHVLTLRQGKLTSYREYLDTAQLLAAYKRT